MEKTKLLTFSALIILLSTSMMAASALTTTVPTFTLNFQTNRLQFVLPQETTFAGTITTTGSVRVWVSDPNQAQIINIGIIDKTAIFNFQATQNGTYTINFENDLHNPIQVTFSYETNPPLLGNNNSTGKTFSMLQLTEIIAAIVLASLLIFIIIRRINKNRKSSTIKTAEN